MSYEIIKSIKLDEKNNKIFLTSSSNNIYPKTFNKWEFMDNEKYTFKDKLGVIFFYIRGGTFKVSKNSKYQIITEYLMEYDLFKEAQDNECNILNNDVNDLCYKVFKEYKPLIKNIMLECSHGIIYKTTKRKIIFTDNPSFALLMDIRKVKDIKNRFSANFKEIIIK